MTPSDLVALVARLRELAPSAVLVDMGGSGVCHSAADAIEQLQAELVKARKIGSEYYGIMVYTANERDALRAELEAVKQKIVDRIGPLIPDNSMVICPQCTSQFAAISVNDQKMRADAERYQWLRNRAWPFEFKEQNPEDADAAIDAARAQAGEK